MKKMFLILIVFLAFVLRIYNVATIPPALSWDEVSIGYNAYSILKTGKDEHGRFLPLDTFIGYGDYKPPLPIYLTVPSVAFFGLNEFAVRLPSVLFGTATVLLTFFLVLVLFPNLSSLALLSSLLLAISPWHIQLSRGGFEANIATFFIALGVFLALRARKNPRLLLVTWLPFVAGIYAFNSSRYVGPFLGLGLFVMLVSAMRKHVRWATGGVIIALICILPILPHLVSKEARLRFEEVNIFTNLDIVKKSNDRIAADGNALWSKALHNRRVGFAREYLLHFVDHFEPWFLFIKGDGNPKFSIQDVGQLYLIEFPFLILGFFWLFAKERKNAWLLLYWLLVAIVPAAAARETPHALRIENSLPVWQIVIAYGIVMTVLQKKKLQWAAVILIGGLYLGSMSFYLHNYYRHYAQEFSGEWQYGYREAIRYAQEYKYLYKKIVITETIGRPYMYTAFYTVYDPDHFRAIKTSTFDAAGFYHVSGFDTYEFVKEGVAEFEKNTLYILAPKDTPAGANVKLTVKALNGTPVLVVFEI